MAEQKSPAFQFYVKDWRSSTRVSRMSFKERGMYFELLLEQWDKGPLPLDPRAIAERIGAAPSEFAKCWPTLKLCFHQTPDGWLNDRLERERVKQQLRKQRASDLGRKGAATTWLGHSKPNSHAIPPKNGEAIPEKQSANGFALSIASAIASASASALAPAASQTAITDDEIAKRGGWLVERYGELYAEHRRGAHYRQRPNLDWTEACDLCRHWDNQRLEKLATVVLTTDEPWIASTDRSFKIFAMKATWADDRLTAAEQASR